MRDGEEMRERSNGEHIRVEEYDFRVLREAEYVQFRKDSV